MSQIVQIAALSFKSIFLLPQTFFGLSDKYVESVYEEIFYLKQYGGWSFIEAYNLPVKIRQWFLRRLIKQLEQEQEAIKKAQKK